MYFLPAAAWQTEDDDPAGDGLKALLERQTVPDWIITNIIINIGIFTDNTLTTLYYILVLSSPKISRLYQTYINTYINAYIVGYHQLSKILYYGISTLTGSTKLCQFVINEMIR